MVYESQISFTLDTICPWTYLARRRLDLALEDFRKSEDAKDVNFSIKFLPYQLYPEAPQEGESKYDWYLREKYDNDGVRMSKYEALMSAYGLEVGIPFKFDGTIANTLHAHRVIQAIQQSKGPDAAAAVVNDLYGQYFTQGKHPSAKETLQHAAQAAGLSEEEAKKLAEDEDEGLMEAKMLEREQRSNGVDAVPVVTLEGRKRDFTLEGAKSIEEYKAELVKVAREAR